MAWLASGYFDENIDDRNNERCFSIAGFYGSAYGALELDFGWRDVLRRWDFAYFKSSELEYGFGEFAQYRDDPQNVTAPLSSREKNLIREIKTEFVDIVCDVCASGEMKGVGATCVLPDFHLFREQEPELSKRLPDVFTLCGDLMLM